MSRHGLASRPRVKRAVFSLKQSLHGVGRSPCQNTHEQNGLKKLEAAIGKRKNPVHGNDSLHRFKDFGRAHRPAIN